jgi:hypothetical protein
MDYNDYKYQNLIYKYNTDNKKEVNDYNLVVSYCIYETSLIAEIVDKDKSYYYENENKNSSNEWTLLSEIPSGIPPMKPIKKPEEIEQKNPYDRLGGGGRKKPAHKRTDKKVKIGSVTRCVYKGARGGEYVKMNNKFVSLKTALKSSKK